MVSGRNLKQMLGKLVSQWYFCLIACCITLPAAYVYLRIVPAVYKIRASILLGGEKEKDIADRKKESASKSSVKDVELQDAAGLLRSFSTIEHTVKSLPFGVSYHSYKDLKRTEYFEDAPFSIIIDSTVNQVVDLPVYIERISSTRYRVKAEGSNLMLYNFVTGETEGSVADLRIDEEVPLDKKFSNKYLSFTIAFDGRKGTAEGEELYFELHQLQTVAAEYQTRLRVEQLSPDSRIIDLTLTGNVLAKEKAFMTSLIDLYIGDETGRKNEQTLKTIKFIDEQLLNPNDTLSERMRNYLVEKRVEARIALASNAAATGVLDKPYAANAGRPVYPDTMTIYLIALGVGIMGGIFFIVLRDVLSDSLVTSDDVERHTKIPFIGTISHANKRDQNAIVAHARSAVGESFRSLRVNLQYLTLNTNASVIGITSSREGEGKTFCSVNLAAVMAYSGRRTILIDTDMRRPRVASYFQLENRKGLSNFLVGDGALKEIINNTEHKGFDVISSGPIPPNPVDLIGNPRMEELINSLKQSYSTIIIDSPPLGYVSEYIILMKYTDANLYVVRSNYTDKNGLKKINKLFDSDKARNFSVLLNDVKTTKASGSYYSYGYGYKY